MKNFDFRKTASLLSQVRPYHAKSQAIVIVAAARTPCGKYQSQLAPLSAQQLGQIAVEAAVKRSAVPLEHINHIFMNDTHTLPHELENNFVFSKFLKKSKYTPMRMNQNSGMNAFQKALEFVKSQPQAVVVAGGAASATNTQTNENLLADNKHKDEDIDNYLEKSLASYKKSLTEGEFDLELVPLKVQKQRGQSRIIEEILHDEALTEKCNESLKTFRLGDGASAVVLTSLHNAHELNLAPLAVIKGFETFHKTANILPMTVQCLQKLFSKIAIEPQQLKYWEIDDASPQLINCLEQTFKLDPVSINPHGSSQILGHSPLNNFTRQLTHISHALKPSEYGCVISSCYQQTSLLLIQKLCQMPVSQRLPLVTLYTKTPCPLCDMLVEELELNFPGEYELEKVFIDTKENVRFLRLYRYDIPVVFLNKQFLCMHRLNHGLFRKQLNMLKNTFNNS